jgi:hypothetical protein
MVFISISIVGCEVKEADLADKGNLLDNGFYILNEGNFLGGNGSISFFSYDSIRCYNNLFLIANNRPLGDVAHSVRSYKNSLSIVVNNSGKIEFVDENNMISKGRISNLISPRFIDYINDNKAYVTSLYSDSIVIVDPENTVVTGYINLGATSEYILINEEYAYVSHWSGGESISIVSTESDEVLRNIKLSSEPGNIVVDKSGFIWVLCNGGYRNEELPALYKLMPQTGAVVNIFEFEQLSDSPTELSINSAGSELYFVNGDIFNMSITDTELPIVPLIQAAGRNFYSMDIDPKRGNILVSDAKDYMKNGTVYIYSYGGEEIGSFSVGIIPGSFCFSKNI